MSGNTSEIGDVGGSPGKSSLFFLTVTIVNSVDLGIGLTGEKVHWLVKQRVFCAVRCASDDP